MTSEADIEFVRSVWSRRPLFTYIFFGFNILIFVLMTLGGGTTNEATLIAFGVKSNDLIHQGQYWRFVTPIFIHIGLLHLGFNSYALWIVGPQVEKLYGSARFVLLYIATGVAGVLGSYLYRPDVSSAGASGAIFGLFGVLLIFGIRNRATIPAVFRSAVGTGILPVIVINLVIGYMVPQIDLSAHIGGLLAGMALAAIVPFQRPGTGTHRFFTAVQATLLALVMLSFLEVAVHYDGPRFAFQNVFTGWGILPGGESKTDEYIKALNDAEGAFNTSMIALEPAGGAKPTQRLPVKEVASAIDQLKAAPSIAPKADALTAELLVLMQDEYGLLQDVQRDGMVTLMNSRRGSANVRKFQAFMQAFNAWVQSDGGRYGIVLRQPR